MDDAPSFSARPEEKLPFRSFNSRAHKTHQYSGPIPRKSWNSWTFSQKFTAILNFQTVKWLQNISKFQTRKKELEKIEFHSSKFTTQNSELENSLLQLSNSEVKIVLGMIWPWNDLKRPQWANMSSLKLYAGINSRLS